MTETVREVCTSALRKARQVRIGGTPAAEEMEAAKATLQSMYHEAIGNGWFGRLIDVSLTDATAYEAGENERIYNNAAGDPEITITLPETIDDTVTGETRPVRDYSVVEVVGATNRAFLYSARLGAWQDLTNLTLNSEAPLADRSFDGLSSLLALRIAGDYGADVSAATAMSAASFLSLITHKADRARAETPVDYF